MKQIIKLLKFSFAFTAICAFASATALGQGMTVKLVPATPVVPASASGTVGFTVIQSASTIAIPNATAIPTGAALTVTTDETDIPSDAQGVGTANPSGPMLSPEQLDDLRREYNGASSQDREALRAYMRDMGIDIKKVLGGPGESMEPNASSLAQAVRMIEFTRTPQTVLAARSKIGFAVEAKPPATDFAATAKWLQLQVFAGEWDALGDALGQLPPADAIAVYTQILQTINRSQRGDPNQKPDPGLLPEEVLAIADSAPEALSDWQVTILAQLLKDAAEKYSTAPMLQKLDANTRMFGRQDAAHRERTVKFLVAAGMALDAAAYFPPLDDARAKLDAVALFNYGRYHEDFANSNRAGGETESQLRTAWGLYCETALIESADAGLRQDAMRRAIDLLPSMPPARASEWLNKVFANATLAPAALEIIALKAVSLRDSQLDLAQRAQTILTMKESVDTLLAQTGLDIRLLRVPLRMLTTALVGEAESALDGDAGGGGANRGRRNPRQQGPAGPQEKNLLLRAMPSENWMSVLEPSLASRAYRAAVEIATSADEVDVAIDSLSHAVTRFPDQAVELADDFLRRWETRLGPQNEVDPNQMMFIGFARDGMTSAPLTRGRQRRNLDRLARLMLVLEEIGVDPRKLPNVAKVFSACHGRTEVFTKDGITSIFGPIDQLEPETASSLADQMRTGLSGEWRDRKAQQAAGMKRSPEEINTMVERGYSLAIELIDHSIAQRPKSWRYAVTKAGLTYDRVQYKQDQKKEDFATYNQYRKEAFEAFAQTANRYAEVVSRGDQRDDPGVYLAWFSAAVGATELNYLTRDDLLVEGSPQDDQIDLIRKSIQQLPAGAAERHTAAFAQAINDALGKLEPDVKPRIVRHAMRIIGDNPAGASLRRLTDLYQDLMKDEIKLRLAIDGDDQVGSNQRFGATLTLRFTGEVDRETGGFSRYLQNDVWARVGNSYRPMNYRDLLKKSLDASFGDNFEIDGIGFFEALAPPRPIRESGADGWLEKPVAYVVLKAKDPSVDRIPQMSMDMHFNDTSGPVVLPVMSNSPQIDAAKSSGLRPLKNLEVIQTVDLRDMENSQKGRPIIFEIQAKADGIVPELPELLSGYMNAIPGYELSANGIESRPINLIEADGGSSAMKSMMMFNQQPQKIDYIQADETGTYRLPTERSWILTFTPTASTVGSAFTFPTLNDKLQGTLVSRQFSDMDVVTITEPSVAVHARLLSLRNLILTGIACLLIVIGYIALRRRKPVAIEQTSHLPSRITPMSVITALRRIDWEHGAVLTPTQRTSLIAEITTLEQTYFGRSESIDALQNGEATDQLRGALKRWLNIVH